MMKEIESGRKPDPGLLTLLEASLYKLSDTDLADEYRWYAERYISEDSSDLLRAACEMIVIHIGEVVNMPQGARVDKRKNNHRLNAAQVTPRATSAEDAALQDGEDIAKGGPDFEAYAALRDAMLEKRSRASKCPAAQYYELDARLMLLHQGDMVDEYQRYAGLYLDHDIAVGVRGFCEIRLIRLGECLFLPLQTRLILLRSVPALNMLESTNEHMRLLYRVAAGAGPRDRKPAAEAPRIVASESFAATIATAASIGAGGAMLDANGVAVLGPDGKPMFATDERVPSGGTIGAGGVILGPDGQPVNGDDGKPMVVVFAPALDKPADAMATGDEPPSTPTPGGDMASGPMSPSMSTPGGASFVPATPGSGVLQYAKSRDTGDGKGFMARTSSKLTNAMKRAPPGAASPKPADRKKFEMPAPDAGPSMVTGEGMGGQGRVYETTEDGQLIIPGNWFEKMKQREYLGGMMRTPEQMKRLALHDQLAGQVAKSQGRRAADAQVIESVGTDARPVVQYIQPKEYEQMQEQLVGELASFLSGPGNVRSKLKSTAVTRAVPWQEQISDNPRSMLKSTPARSKPEFVNA